MELNQERIENAIVEDAVERLISEERLFDQVQSKIDTRINNLFADRVEAALKERIDSVLTAGFEREYVKTNSFGQPQGAPTTISKELEGLISSYWTQAVDREGKPSSGYNSVTRAEWLMTKICAEDFQKTVKQHALSIAGHVKDAFRAQLNKAVNSTLTEVFYVKSKDDQARKDEYSSHPEV